MQHHITSETIIDYAHGELDPGLDAAVHGHLAACPACREELDVQLALSERLKTAGKAAELDLPPGMRAAIWQAVDRDRAQRRWPALRSWLVPLVGVPALAAAAFGVYLAVPISHPAPGNNVAAVAASFYLNQHATSAELENPLGDHSATDNAMERSFEQGGAGSSQAAEAGQPPAVVEAANLARADGP